MTDPHPRDWAQTGTVTQQCADESAHGEHEWYEKNIFRRQCPGFVGRAGVPKPVEPAGNPRVDALIDALICPSCRTIWNAKKANCSDLWHYDNRPDSASDGMAYTEDMTAPVVIPADQFDELMADEPWSPGAGWERVRAAGLAPELSEEDLAKADAIIAAAGSTVNRELIVEQPTRETWVDAWMRSQPADVLDSDGWLGILVKALNEMEDAAYARGISEGRRQATEAIAHEIETELVGDLVCEWTKKEALLIARAEGSDAT